MPDKKYTVEGLKLQIDFGWFSAYHTLRGMVMLYGVEVVQEALNEISRGLTQRAPDVCPECAGSGKTGSIGLPRECPYCDGTGKRR